MRRLVRGSAALCVLALLVVGAPVGLVALGRFDAFAEIDWAHILTTPDTGALLLGLLTVAGWLAWGVFALSVALELVRLVTNGRVSVRVPGIGWAQATAATLLLAVAALVTPMGATANASPAGVHPGGPVPTPAAATRAEQTASSEPPPAPGQQAGAPAVGEPPAAPVGAGLVEATQRTHRVVVGDDLWTIAQRHYGDGTKWRAIAAANRLDPQGVLLPETVLVLPGLTDEGSASDEHRSSGHDVGATASNRAITVKPGDTLSSLAQRHLGSADRWPELARANADLVQDPDLIDVGWVLTLPGSDAKPAPTATADAPAAGQPTTSTPKPSASSSAPTSNHTSSTTEQASHPGPSELGAPVTHPTTTPSPTSQATTEVTLEAGIVTSREGDDGDRLELLGSMTGLLAVGLAAALTARRRGQLVGRALGRRIEPPALEAQRLESALRRRASEQPVPDQLWAASVIVVGLDENDEPVLLDLEQAGTTVIVSPEDEAGVAHETRQAALAAALTGLVSASWSADAQVVLNGSDLGWTALLDAAQLTVQPCIEQGVIELERRCAERRIRLGRSSVASLREQADLADAWAPQVHIFGEPLSDEHWQRVHTALRHDELAPDGLGISVLAVATSNALPQCGEVLEVGPEHARLCTSGVGFVPQLISQPARRALMDLFEAAATEQTVEAPWWSFDDESTTSLIALEPLSARPDEENRVNAESYPHPTLLLLGPVVLAGARGVEPSRAKGQCLEYCAWIHHNPGRTATAMNRELLVADSTRRSNMSRLRAWLGTTDAGQPYLPEAYSGRIALDPAVSTDWEFAQLLIAGGVNRASSDALVDVLSLVRGAPLADAAPGTWTWAEALRVDMISTLRDVGVVLAQRALDAGDIDLARWAASKALKAAPEDELLMCERIRTEHLAGNRTEVERLVLHVTRSARIIGVDLSEQTICLLQEVMEGRRRAQYA